MSKLNQLSRATFDGAIGVDAPVLVDFYADWCGPCRALSPVLERVAGQREGRVHFHKVDVDAEPELAQRFGIRSIPTLLLFRPGQAAEPVHARTADGLLSAIDGQAQHLAGASG